MERSVIEAKLEALRRDRERLLADLNAVIGAIQLAEQLLEPENWTAPEPPPADDWDARGGPPPDLSPMPRPSELPNFGQQLAARGPI
jgi:hypothetical protein